MSDHSDDPKQSPTLAALTELVNQSPVSPTPAQLGRGLNAVASLLAVGRARQRVLVRVSLAAVAVAAGAGALAIGSWTFTHRAESVRPALAFQTEGGSVIDGGYLRETGDTGITVSFSEGTKFTLKRGTRGRLRSVDSAGARIAIDNGSGLFTVTPRAGAKWMVDAGPFVVTVKGTIFSASWDGPSERLEIRLQQGVVNVKGPVLGGDIALRAGQRLVVNLPKSETVITQDPPESALIDSAAALPLAANDEPPLDQESSVPRKTPHKSGAEISSMPGLVKTHQSRWRDAVAAADWDRILRDTDAVGVESILETATSDDLFALADAARYRRRVALAREALLAERRRFPSAARALDVAYLLGRVEESSERGHAEALKWYNEYLERAPSGTYASEALGRKMILTNKLKGRAQAEPLANAYLQRFPSGTYAGSARALLRAR